MSWFDRYILAPIAPRAALRRVQAQRAVRAAYEAGEASRYRKRRTDRGSANANNQRSAEAIRVLARHLDENFDIASGILDVLVANTVGAGIWPEPQILLNDGTPAEELNSQLIKLFEDWRFRPEVTWRHDYFELQRLVARSYFRDGEVFTNRVTGPVSGIDHGTLVPYSLEALEADFVPYNTVEAKPRIVQGVELNDWGRAVAYHVHKHHPGDAYGSVGARWEETKRVLATTMVHVAFRKRLHQVRGMSMFASIANRLDDIKDIDECERVAARVAASMAAYIKKGNPETYDAPESSGEETTESGRRTMQFEAGIIFDDLEPGEEIGTIDTKRPNNALIPFREAQLRAVAAGTGGASFSSIAKNYNGTYSAQRQELVESYQSYQMAAGPIIYGFCQPVWEGFVDAAIAAGKVVVTRDVDRSTLWDCTHTGPAMPWIDPKKEIDAAVLAMQWKLTSRSRVIRKSGANPDQINREILRDEQQARELGIDISGPKTTPAADPPPPREDDDPNDTRGPGNGASSHEEEEQ